MKDLKLQSSTLLMLNIYLIKALLACGTLSINGSLIYFGTLIQHGSLLPHGTLRAHGLFYIYFSFNVGFHRCLHRLVLFLQCQDHLLFFQGLTVLIPLKK